MFFPTYFGAMAGRSLGRTQIKSCGAVTAQLQRLWCGYSVLRGVQVEAAVCVSTRPSQG